VDPHELEYVEDEKGVQQYVDIAFL